MLKVLFKAAHILGLRGKRQDLMFEQALGPG
jgi:hypothetical protein